MLPAAHRLTDGEGFRQAVRSGRRAGAATVVVHLAAGSSAPDPQVGFVVSRAVGNAVVRNRVRRRLRHLARPHVGSLPAEAVLVVRALPRSAEASYQELRTDLDRCLHRVTS